MILKPGLGVTQGHRNRHGSIRHLWFPINFHSNYGPISHHFRDKRRFQSKIAKCSHPRVFCAPAEEVPLGIGYRRMESKTRVMALPGRERSLTISSAVRIKCINVTYGRTDRRTPGHSKDRAYA